LKEGLTPLHLVVTKCLEEEPAEYEEYKRILKELLFNGARRDIKVNINHDL